jgi:hypothetical protein
MAVWPGSVSASRSLHGGIPLTVDPLHGEAQILVAS